LGNGRSPAGPLCWAAPWRGARATTRARSATAAARRRRGGRRPRRARPGPARPARRDRPAPRRRRPRLSGPTLERPGAALERGDHAAHGFVEQHLDQLLEHAVAELEIDVEVDLAAAVRGRLEDPMVVEMLERTFGVRDVDAVGWREVDPRGEALAHH